MTESKVLARLMTFAPAILDAWCANRNRCVLATATGIDVLAAFDIAATPYPVRTRLANNAYIAARRRGVSPVTAVALGGHVMETAEEADARSWAGHLLIAIPSRSVLLDLDQQQFNRPQYGITFEAAGLFAWPAGTREREYARGGAQLAIIATNDHGYTSGPDWADPRRRATLVAPLCRAIRRGHL